MAEFPDEKVGEGAFAEVYAWAPGQVVKLFRTGVSDRLIRHEARITRAVHAAGAPAPEMLGEMVLEGRTGLVLSRLEGPTLMQLSRTGAMTPTETGAVMVGLAWDLHRTPAPTALPSLRDWLEASFRAGDRIPASIASGLLALVERLPTGEALCHGDLHPGNVIMTARGPRLIDWMGAVRAPAAFDLGICEILLTEIVAERVADPERPRSVFAALKSDYARLVGLSPEALSAAAAPFLPMGCALALLTGVSGAEQARLIRRIDAALEAMDGRAAD